MLPGSWCGALQGPAFAGLTPTHAVIHLSIPPSRQTPATCFGTTERHRLTRNYGPDFRRTRLHLIGVLYLWRYQLPQRRHQPTQASLPARPLLPRLRLNGENSRSHPRSRPPRSRSRFSPRMPRAGISTAQPADCRRAEQPGQTVGTKGRRRPVGNYYSPGNGRTSPGGPRDQAHPRGRTSRNTTIAPPGARLAVAPVKKAAKCRCRRRGRRGPCEA